jgi:hypothetical protein
MSTKAIINQLGGVSGGYGQSIYLGFLLIISLAFLAAAGVYNVMTSLKIADLPEYKDDSDQNAKSAFSYISGAASVCWITLGLTLIAIGILIYLRVRRGGFGGTPRVVLSLLFAFIFVMTIVSFVLSAYSFSLLTTTLTSSAPDIKRDAVRSNYVASVISSFAMAGMAVILLSILFSV